MDSLARSYGELGLISFHWENPVRWASGILSPIYCDHRKILSSPQIWNQWILALEELLLFHYAGVEMVAGVLSAGVPHATALSLRNGLPLCYVRPKEKEHGQKRMVEGANPYGKKVVVVEDLLSTGGSVIRASKELREAGAHVVGVLSLFSYDLTVLKEKMEESSLPYVSVMTLPKLLDCYVTQGELSYEQRDCLTSWMRKY